LPALLLCKSIIGALKNAASEWEFEHINFVVDNRGSVVESNYYTKLKKLDIQEDQKDKLFVNHVTHVCVFMCVCVCAYVYVKQHQSNLCLSG